MNIESRKRKIMKKFGRDKLEGITLLFLVVSLVLIGYNSFEVSQMKNIAKINQVLSQPKISGGSVNTVSNVQINGIDVLPKGIPEIYGRELGVSFDDVSVLDPNKANEAIAKLAVFDEGITLEGNELSRYINIAGSISCEYCCGAAAIIFKDGKAACGCAHSYAMRGLAKYLLTNHGSEYRDAQILEEMGKWKTLFFPSALTQKAAVLKEKGIEINYINLASNKYRGIEKKTNGGAMVGGC